MFQLDDDSEQCSERSRLSEQHSKHFQTSTQDQFSVPSSVPDMYPRSACLGSTLVQACLGSTRACSSLALMPPLHKGLWPMQSIDELCLSMPKLVLSLSMLVLARSSPTLCPASPLGRNLDPDHRWHRLAWCLNRRSHNLQHGPLALL